MTWPAPRPTFAPRSTRRNRRRNGGEQALELGHVARLHPLRHARLPHERVARELPRGHLPLQRAYLEIMDQKLNGAPASSEEIRMLVKGELHALDAQLKTAVAAPSLDESTKRT